MVGIKLGHMIYRETELNAKLEINFSKFSELRNILRMVLNLK